MLSGPQDVGYAAGATGRRAASCQGTASAAFCSLMEKLETQLLPHLYGRCVANEQTQVPFAYSLVATFRFFIQVNKIHENEANTNPRVVRSSIVKHPLLQFKLHKILFKNKKPGRTVKTVSPRLLSLRVTASAVCFLSDQASYAAEP